MNKSEKITINTIREKIHAGGRISVLALYDYPFAALAQQAGVDAIIVGDSAAMVNYGYENPLQADMDMLVRHTQAVKRGGPNLFIIGDMPFMSYQPSIETAIRNAGRFVSEGHADAVKLEGGTAILDTVRAIVNASIPVVGHIGLTPQSAAITGGFKAQGREAQSAIDIVNQARQLEDAGICMLVLECVPDIVAEAVTKKISVPIIGIGSGPSCHGQVQVLFDILGIYPRFTPKFVHKYAELAPTIIDAMKAYIDSIAKGTYPADEHTYHMKAGEAEAFKKMLE
jgi:3-methyl-2-oxobutanoate hydroxymethyltransferase